MEADDDLRAELERLRSELESVHDRLDAIEARVEIDSKIGSADTQLPDDAGPAAERPSVPSQDDTREPTTAVATDVEEKPVRRRRIGAPAKWFGWIGIFALVIGVLLLIRYAIDAGYLGHGARILLAVGTGIGLVALGRVVGERERYETWARTVTGGGMAIAFFGIYATYGLETYREALGLPLWVVLVLLGAIVVLTVVLALEADSRPLAYEAFLFGYIVVALTGELGPVALAAGLLLAAGIVALCTRRPWIELALGGVLGTYLVYLAWFDGHADAFAHGAPYLLVTFALFLSVPYLLRPVTDGPWRIPGTAWRHLVPTLTVVNALAFAALFGTLLGEAHPDARPVFFLALAACFALASAPRVGAYGRPPVYLGVTFVVLAIVLQFSTFWVTIVCAALLPVLVVLARETGVRDARYAAYVVTAFVVIKLLTVDTNELPAGSLDAPLAATRPWPFLVAILVFAGLSWLLTYRDEWLTDRERSGRVTVPVVYAWLATVLALLVTGFELDGAQVTLVWAVLGIGLLGGAIRFGRTELRQQSVAVLALTSLKVFLVDTADLDPLPRTLSFLALGVLLLVAAFVYTRYVREDDSTDSADGPDPATGR